MLNLLILTAGTNACYHTAKVLKEKFNNNFRLIGADINEEYLIPTIHFLDNFYKVPLSISPNYYEKIIDICEKEHIDFILPSFDIDQILFNQNNKDLLKLGIKSLGISEDIINIYTSKRKMNQFLTSISLPVPKTYEITEIKDNKKYFIKPIDGVGSIGAKSELGSKIKKMDCSKLLIQEVCQNVEYTVECFCYNKRISYIVRERIATKSGVCTKAKFCLKNTEIDNIINKFVKSIDCPFCFNIQLMKNSENRLVITDVNLRLAGGGESCICNWMG